MKQRNIDQFINPFPLLIKKINRKIMRVFHYFDFTKLTVNILFCTGNVENINEATNFYEKYENKIPLEWPLRVLPDIMSELPKLKTKINKLKKHLLDTFSLLKKFSSKKKIYNFLIENTKKELNFLKPKNTITKNNL